MSVSWLDLVLVSEVVLRRFAGTKSVESPVNPSDHWLLLIELEMKRPKTVEMSYDGRINWSKPDVGKNTAKALRCCWGKLRFRLSEFCCGKCEHEYEINKYAGNIH